MKENKERYMERVKENKNKVGKKEKERKLLVEI
jgi:hypothetical protein